jgi:hypothetical protein
MFRDCKGLTGTIPALPASLTNGLEMFRGCTGLTGTVPSLPASLTNGLEMFQGCIGVDNYNAGTLANTTCTQWTNAFFGCALPSASVNAILADFRTAHTNGTINAANLLLGISGGTNGAPTDQGITDRTFLVGLGAVIATN